MDKEPVDFLPKEAKKWLKFGKPNSKTSSQNLNSVVVNYF